MSRRSLRISLFLVGLGVGNKDMNLNMVFSFRLAGRVRTYSAPPLVVHSAVCKLLLSGDFGLQVSNQLGGSLTGKFFKAGNIETSKHLSNVGVLIVCFSA